MRIFFLGVALLLLAASPVQAQEAEEASIEANDVPAAAELERDLRFLAADELMGRRAGTAGNNVAARYIAEQFRAAGVDTLAGANGYFQPVPLAYPSPGERMQLASVPLDSTTTHRTAHDSAAFLSNNVVGVVRGSDPDLRDEYVVLLAHYDHIGAGLRNGRGATPADSIFNGARDNGMGTVALIHAARELADDPPKRSVLLLAVTAEEEGLLGSRYYVQHPLVPLDQTVYVLNTDGAGYSDTSIVTLVGHDRTTADSLISAAAQDAGLTVYSTQPLTANLFERSDNINFARQGIPAPTLSQGFRAFSDPGVSNYYHNAEDEVDANFDFGYLYRFAEAYAGAARRIADAPARPTWTPGDPFEDEAESLYGTR